MDRGQDEEVEATALQPTTLVMMLVTHLEGNRVAGSVFGVGFGVVVKLGAAISGMHCAVWRRSR